MVANVVQISIPTRGSLWASAIRAVLALDSTANQSATARVGQRSAHNSAPPTAPVAAASVQVSATTPRGPVGVQSVARATTAKPPAITEMVARIKVAMPRA